MSAQLSREHRGGEPTPRLSPLSAAARAGDTAEVQRLLAEGHPVDGSPGEIGTPLWHACGSDAPAAGRIAVAQALLRAGASTRRDDAGATAMHAAASRRSTSPTSRAR